MPYVGLILTSIGFIIPGIIAWRRRFRVEAASSILVSISSVCYHGTLHPIARYVDMAVAHSLGVTSIGRATMNMILWRRGWIECCVVAGTLGSIGIYWFKSRNNPHESSKYWHMFFHLSGQTTWIAHILTKCW